MACTFFTTFLVPMTLASRNTLSLSAALSSALRSADPGNRSRRVSLDMDSTVARLHQGTPTGIAGDQTPARCEQWRGGCAYRVP